MILGLFKAECRHESTEELAAAIAAVEATRRRLPGGPVRHRPQVSDSNSFIAVEVYETARPTRRPSSASTRSRRRRDQASDGQPHRDGARIERRTVDELGVLQTADQGGERDHVQFVDQSRPQQGPVDPAATVGDDRGHPETSPSRRTASSKSTDASPAARDPTPRSCSRAR